VFISPWLDVATDYPSHRAAPRDAMLAIPGLVEAGRAYAGELPLDDPRVSPIHGDMSDLPPITAFSGTADLLNPDSHLRREACVRAGTPSDLIEAPDIPRAYPLLPTPEGRAACDASSSSCTADRRGCPLLSASACRRPRSRLRARCDHRDDQLADRGIGPILSCTILAEIGDAKRFRRARQPVVWRHTSQRCRG
jgi:alpha/beta hydrolase fold